MDTLKRGQVSAATTDGCARGAARVKISTLRRAYITHSQFNLGTLGFGRLGLDWTNCVDWFFFFFFFPSPTALLLRRMLHRCLPLQLHKSLPVWAENDWIDFFLWAFFFFISTVLFKHGYSVVWWNITEICLLEVVAGRTVGSCQLHGFKRGRGVFTRSTADRHSADRHVSLGHLNFFGSHAIERTEGRPYRPAGTGPSD